MRHLGIAKRFISGAMAVAILAYLPGDGLAKVPSGKTNDGKATNVRLIRTANGKLIAQSTRVATTDTTGAALTSILNDITKALSESSDYNNLTDAKQKTVVGIAISVLKTALSNPQLIANRIITTEDKARAENSMSAETWDSGEIVVRNNDPQSPVCHAVASCIWAKKANGLINLTIAGNSNELVNGEKLGDFIFVASGRSGIESGFDIQSQSSVNYWIGKLTQFVADTAGSPTSQISTAAETAPAADASADTSGDPPAADASSSANATEPKPEQQDEGSKPAQATNTNPEAVDIPAPSSSQSPSQPTTAKVSVSSKPEVAEEKAPRRSYLLLKAPSLKNLRKKEAAKPEAKPDAKPPVKAEVKPEATVQDAVVPAEKLPESKIQPHTIEKVQVEKAQAEQVPTETDRLPEIKTSQTEIKTNSPDKVAQTTPIPSTPAAPAPQEPTNLEAGKIETTMSVPPVKLEPPVEVGPSPDAMVITPDKAQAGQLITVSVVNARLVAESGVNVDFNGTVLTTGANGQIQYLVPDESTPGPSLKIAIAGKQLATTKIVHILQPLSTPDKALPPHVDRVTANASKFDTVTIQGHNFNGQAGDLSVTIDGKWDAQILSTSPLELKILVPEEVPAGQHTISVTNAGLKSNAALFSLISLQVAPDARPGQVPTKLIVRALGTAKPVAVHLRNNTPNIITIVKGNDLRIKTPGGKDNSIAVSVRLKQRGNYNIEASIE